MQQPPGRSPVQDGYFGDLYLKDDTNPSAYLKLTNAQDLTANRTLSIITGDTDRTLTLSGNATLSGFNTGDQTITLTGDVTGSGTGSFAATLANTTVTAGSYGSATQTVQVTFDGKGRATSATAVTVTPTWASVTSKPTTLSGYGITDALSSSTASVQDGYFGDVYLKDDTNPSAYLKLTNAQDLTAGRTLSIVTGDADRTLTLSGNATLSGSNTGDQTITLTGDVTGSGTGSFTATLANTAVAAGSYGSATQAVQITFDGKGRATSASAVTVTPAWSIVTGKPTTLSGYGITDGAPIASPSFTGTAGYISGTYAQRNECAQFRTSDYGSGKPYLFVKPGAAAPDWTVGTWDGSASPGTINFQCAAVSGPTPSAADSSARFATTAWVGGALASFIPAWTSISGKPTTLNGYGITDGAPSAAPTFTGIAAFISGTYAQRNECAQFRTSDFGTGFPYLFIKPGAAVPDWTIGTWDTVSSPGVINFQCAAVSGPTPSAADSSTRFATTAWVGGALASFTPAWSSIVGKPTTLTGYGITDALSASTSSVQDGYFGDVYLRDDTNPSAYLKLTNAQDLTAGRTLSISTGDADRTLTLAGNATLSGTNTGDQTITLTGDVSGSGTGSFTATIAVGAVTNAKQAQMPALTLKGNAGGSTATPADLTVAQARTLLGAGSGNGFDADTVDGLHAAALQAGDYRNLVINGCFRVSHRASKTLSTSWQTGPVDLIAVAAGGTVSTGTIVQASGVTQLSKSGYACQVQSATLTGAGTISWRHRIEARNASAIANGAATVTARTYHDVGSSVTYTITVNKPTAADNFASVTQIATGTVAVANATNADLSLSVPNLGDCSAGLEIIIFAACGAITTKNFYLGDLQLVAGSLALPMMPRPIATETMLVARYLRPCAGLFGKANSATTMQVVLSHPDMRATPSYEVNSALSFTDAVTADFVQSQASITSVQEANSHNGRVSCGFFSGLTSGTVMIQKGSGGTILASAEL